MSPRRVERLGVRYPLDPPEEIEWDLGRRNRLRWPVRPGRAQILELSVSGASIRPDGRIRHRRGDRVRVSWRGAEGTVIVRRVTEEILGVEFKAHTDLHREMMALIEKRRPDAQAQRRTWNGGPSDAQ